MQTFLPSASFIKSAQALDRKRLGKQRVETMQIMQTLLGYRIVTSKTVKCRSKEYYDLDGYYVHKIDLQENTEYEVLSKEELVANELPAKEWTIVPATTKGWTNHPAVNMWRGYEWALMQYQKAVCNEWRNRGYIDTCFFKTRDLFMMATTRQLPDQFPSWLGNKDFHISHQSNLVRKDPIHYRPLYPNVPNDLPYVWPKGLRSSNE